MWIEPAAIQIFEPIQYGCLHAAVRHGVYQVEYRYAATMARNWVRLKTNCGGGHLAFLSRFARGAGIETRLLLTVHGIKSENRPAGAQQTELPARIAFGFFVE